MLAIKIDSNLTFHEHIKFYMQKRIKTHYFIESIKVHGHKQNTYINEIFRLTTVYRAGCAI